MRVHLSLVLSFADGTDRSAAVIGIRAARGAAGAVANGRELRQAVRGAAAGSRGLGPLLHGHPPDDRAQRDRLLHREGVPLAPPRRRHQTHSPLFP